MSSTTEKAIEASQEQLGRSLDRARMGEDKDLAARVRDLGERLVRLLYGLLKMTEIHALDNNAFKKPSKEFSIVTETLMELLGAIHIVTVEDQVFVNDILEKLSEAGYEPKRFVIKKIKTVNKNIHAVIVDVDDEKTEQLVALSVLQDKNKYKIIKNIQ